MADLTRVRNREALKDADLVRLRTERVLLAERLDAKTQAHVTVSIAFNDLVQHIQTGQLDYGTIIGIASRAGVATMPAPQAAGGGAGPVPLPAAGAAAVAGDAGDAGAAGDAPADDDAGPDFVPSSPPYAPPEYGGPQPASPSGDSTTSAYDDLDGLDSLRSRPASPATPATPGGA